MKIFIIGSGAREHALAWKFKRSPLVKEIYCAPGNAGIAEIAHCVDIAPENTDKLLQFAYEKKINLTVVGPEAPLVAGIVDQFEEEGLKIFGPSEGAAQLEGSKVFAKEFMHSCNIPTALFKTFDHLDKAKKFLAKADYPVVVKADGLAAGKGVIICNNRQEAEDAATKIMKEKIFGEAGARVVIEECLKGEEVSILAISDGEHYVLLDSAQDYKRIFDDDLGPNTGGMGAFSPTPIVNEELLKTIEARIIDPTIRGMRRQGTPFRGILYAGLMITIDGPKVLEYNVRFGDPETEAILPRLKNDLVDVLLAACEGRLNRVLLDWDKRSCISVVMSSGGYPGKYETGKEIQGLDHLLPDENAFVFHAGTKKQGDRILTNGGRVLAVTSLGNNLEEAIASTYKAVEKIKFERAFFRRDIGHKALGYTDDKHPKASTHR